MILTPSRARRWCAPVAEVCARGRGVHRGRGVRGGGSVRCGGVCALS